MANPHTQMDAFRHGDTLAVRVRSRLPTAAAPRPLHIAMLLDVSGSMSSSRLDAVKRTLHAGRDLLAAGDRVTLVTFHDVASVVSSQQLLDADGKTAFYAAVDAIRTGGSTNLSVGIEELLTQRATTNGTYDALLVLTDGYINAGVTSATGLMTMFRSLGTMAIHTFGYGADHNRQLLKELAVRSRGTYTYIDNDEVLPIALGDMLSGLRGQVLAAARVEVMSPGWTCMEMGAETGASAEGTYMLGSVVAERDYWVVFRGSDDGIGDVPAKIRLMEGNDVVAETVSPLLSSDDEALMAREQRLRCRVATVLTTVSERMELGQELGQELGAELAELRAELEALEEPLRLRPLVVRMIAQVAEITEAVRGYIPRPPMLQTPFMWAGASPAAATLSAPALPADTLARLATGCTYLGLQRGVVSQVADPDGGVPSTASMFSSPTQHTASARTRQRYTHSMDPAPSSPTQMGEID
jgi:hypothetical protein